MRLEPIAREAVNFALSEAHYELGRSRAIAGRFVELIRDMEPSGQEWVVEYLDELMVVGAMKVCADWRRTKNGTAKTRKGTPVPVPLFAATEDADGIQTVQRFETLGRDALRARKEQMEAQRNTLSREIRLYADLLEQMDADPSVQTVGDALAALERAA